MTSTSKDLTTALQSIPQSWALTPVNQKKAYFTDWQQTGLARELIERELTNGKADGFGILTGELSGGLIAIDCDGHEPHARFREILGGDIPKTVTFASGKDGRAQYLFSVPQEHWTSITTKKEGSPNEGGQLEFRWNGCYSVLPPSAHPETNGYYWDKSPNDCPIAPLPEKALNYLLNLCKPKASPAKLAPKKAGNVPPIPLERCLSNAHRQALENGFKDGGRGDMAIAIARDLLGCVAWLDSLDEPYSGDAHSLFIDFCDRCSPPLEKSRRISTWRSANKYKPEPSINDAEAFQNCINKWKREYGVPATERPAESHTTQLMDDVTAAVNNLSRAALTAELAAIAKKHDRPISSIEKMATQIQDELETQEDQEETRESIEHLQHTAAVKLNVYDVFPAELAEPINRVAKAIGHDTGAYVGAFLFAAGGIAHMGTTIKVMNGFDDISPTIYGALVAPPGRMKSAIYKKAIEKPLGKLQITVNNKYKADLSQYKTALKNWEKSNDEELPEPIEPQQVVLFSTNATIEGLTKQACFYVNSSSMYLNDELSAVLKGLNSYKKSGSDEEALLAHYDPCPVYQVRASGVLTSDHDVRFAVFGCLTPSGLDSLIKDKDDSNGQAGRFLLFPVEFTPQLLKPSDINITGHLADILQKIHNFPQTEFIFSEEAFDFYNPIQFAWKQQSNATDNGWKSNIYSKACGQLARVAGALHLIDCAIADQLTVKIPKETVARAKLVLDFCMGFALSKCAEKSGELPPKLTKLISLAEKKGTKGLTVNEGMEGLRETTNGKTIKPKSSEIIGHFKSIESLNLGKVEKTPRSFKLFSLKSCPNCPDKPQSFTGQWIDTGRAIAEVLPSCPDKGNFAQVGQDSEPENLANLDKMDKAGQGSGQIQSLVGKELQPYLDNLDKISSEDLFGQEQANYISLAEIEVGQKPIELPISPNDEA